MIDFIIAGFLLLFHFWVFIVVIGVVGGILSIFVGDDDSSPWSHSKESI